MSQSNLWRGFFIYFYPLEERMFLISGYGDLKRQYIIFVSFSLSLCKLKCLLHILNYPVIN